MKKRLLSGMRPTGPLHLGNYHGALANWVRLQEEYDCFFFIADWHALTSDYEKPDLIKGYSDDIMLDWLSVGLTPEQSTLFVQSHIKEHAELFLILSHDHAGALARAQPDLQGPDRAAQQQGPVHLRVSGLPGAAGRGHHHVQALRRTGGRGPGAARRDHPRDRPALQLFLRPGVPGARGHPDRDPQTARDRPPQDEQELRQRHLPLRSGRCRRDQGGDHDHGPPAHAQVRPRQPRRVQRVRLPQALLAAGGRSGSQPALPHGRHRVRGVQETDGPALECLPRPDPQRSAATTRSAPGASRRSSRPGSDKARQTACRTMEEVRAAIKL